MFCRYKVIALFVNEGRCEGMRVRVYGEGVREVIIFQPIKFAQICAIMV